MNYWKVVFFFIACLLIGVMTITPGAISITVIGKLYFMFANGESFNYSSAVFMDDLQYGLFCGSTFGVMMFFLCIYYKKKGY
jgi:hypothetical protein